MPGLSPLVAFPTVFFLPLLKVSYVKKLANPIVNLKPDLNPKLI